MFDQLIASSVSGSITLASSDAPKRVYFLPASSVLAANNANKGFTIPYNDIDIKLSPKAITEYNDTVVTLLEDIKRKNIKDYFVKITVNRYSKPQNVEGEKPITDQYEVIIEVVGAVDSIKDWDKDMISELAKIIDSKIKNKSIRDKLYEMLTGNELNEEMVKYITSLVNESKRELSSKVANSLSGLLKGAGLITNLETPIVLVPKGLEPDANIRGYQLVNNNWLSKELTPYGEVKAIYTKSPGLFVFTGRPSALENLGPIPNAGNLSGIIGKYGLDDFFGANFTTGDTATRGMVIGSIARMAGAKRGDDGASWLKNNLGISVSGRNSSGSIQAQEAVHLVMSLYEAKTNTKISTLKIRNQNITAGIEGINQQYLQSIKAAYDLGILTDEDFVPSSGITIGKLLDMLTNLNNKVKL